MSKTKNKKEKKAKARKKSVLEEDKSFTDFQCPICLEILIEPVQMPCQHELCMDCFQTHVQDTSLHCPMCRLRISVWTRKHSKTNTLVNTERWELIQAMFPERVQRRLDGLDDIQDDEHTSAPKHILAADGEVGKEFQEQLKKIEAEDQAISQASIEYIRQIQEEERIERQKQEELDLAAAQELQKQEMANLGVTLKSPSQHQREILALMKPKSPMKLRQREMQVKPCSSSKSKAHRNILTSPNRVITSFFKKTTNTSPKLGTSTSRNIDTNCSISKLPNTQGKSNFSHKKDNEQTGTCSKSISNSQEIQINTSSQSSNISESSSSSQETIKKTVFDSSKNLRISCEDIAKKLHSTLNDDEVENSNIITLDSSEEILEDSPIFHNNNDTDFEMALTLQRHFDSKWERKKAQPLPLRTRNQVDIRTSSSTITSKGKRKALDQNVVQIKLPKKT